MYSILEKDFSGIITYIEDYFNQEEFDRDLVNITFPSPPASGTKIITPDRTYVYNSSYIPGSNALYISSLTILDIPSFIENKNIFLVGTWVTSDTYILVDDFKGLFIEENNLPINNKLDLYNYFSSSGWQFCTI